MKLTIAEVNDSFEPLMDGVALVTKNYTENLNKLGHSAYAIVPRPENAEQYDLEHHIDYTINGKILHVSKTMDPYGIVYYPLKTQKKIYSIRYDIVHTHSPFFAGHLGLNIAKKQNLPIISTFHTFFKDDVQGILKNERLSDEFIKKVMMQFYYKVDEVWTPSEGAKQKIYKEYFYEGDIRVVENGCDMPLPSPEEKTILRAKGLSLIGISENIPVFIYIGQHKDEKNISLILESLKILKAEKNRFQMVFVGEGHCKEKYEKYVKSNNLEDCVKFLGRISDRSTIQALYAASDVFLFPSLYDTSCLVMREAAAFEVPLVYIKGACTSEGIIDGEDGFLAENNPQLFADKLEYLIKNPTAVKHAGTGAKQHLYKSWEDVANTVQNLYFDIIERKNREK